MKGLWKTKVSGYKKDNKRKRTTFKHVLKDNKDVLLKRFNRGRLNHSNVVKEEETIIIENKKEIKYRQKEIRFGDLFFYNLKSNFSFDQVFFEYDGSLYTRHFEKIEDFKIIKFPSFFNDFIGICKYENKEYKFIFTEKGNPVENYFKNPIISISNSSKKITLNYGTTFIYNKPFLESEYGYIRHYTKKYYARYVNKSNRVFLRNWFSNFDFDKEIKMNDNTLSIARLVY